MSGILQPSMTRVPNRAQYAGMKPEATEALGFDPIVGAFLVRQRAGTLHLQTSFC